MAYCFFTAVILPEEQVRDAPPSDDEPLSEIQLRTIVLLLQGERYPAISAILGVTLDEVRQLALHPQVRDQIARVEQAITRKVTQAGEFEPITAAKAEAPAAMRRMIAQSRAERDPKVKLAAHQAVLKFAGVEPARRIELTTPDKILDQMTPEELALFAAKKLWPARFKNALRAYLPQADTTRSLPIDITPTSVQTTEPAADLPASTLPPVKAS